DHRAHRQRASGAREGGAGGGGMKAREMYAPAGWDTDFLAGFVTKRERYGFAGDPVRVLVTEIPEGMPDFKPGDRVIRGSGSGPYEVEAIYRDRNGRWCAVLDTM